MIRHLGTDAPKADSQASITAFETSENCQSLFVATDLEIRKFAWVRMGEIDIEQNGKVLCLLSLEFFAWLRSRMVTAQAAHKAWKFPENAWNTLCSDSTPCKELAVREFGKDSLQEVLHSFPQRTTGHPRFVPSPRRNPSKFPERTGFIPGTKLGNVSSR